MNGLILAAGRGSRLKELTNEVPKCLVELNGKPLLNWQMEALSGAGITNIAVVTGYKAYLLEDKGLACFNNNRWESTNMVFSLLCADTFMLQSETIITYSDIIFPSQTVTELLKCEEDISITFNTEWLSLWNSRFKDPLTDAETFVLDEQNYLVEIGKRAKKLEDIKGQYMGILKITQKGWNDIKKYLKSKSKNEIDILDMTSLLMELIGAGFKIKAIPIEGNWYEIDNQDDLKFYEQQLQDQKSWLTK